jgi:hypothetical protein
MAPDALPALPKPNLEIKKRRISVPKEKETV